MPWAALGLPVTLSHGGFWNDCDQYRSPSEPVAVSGMNFKMEVSSAGELRVQVIPALQLLDWSVCIRTESRHFGSLYSSLTFINHMGSRKARGQV